MDPNPGSEGGLRHALGSLQIGGGNDPFQSLHLKETSGFRAASDREEDTSETWQKQASHCEWLMWTLCVVRQISHKPMEQVNDTMPIML